MGFWVASDVEQWKNGIDPLRRIFTVYKKAVMESCPGTYKLRPHLRVHFITNLLNIIRFMLWYPL
jgi:hypothetical protein